MQLSLQLATLETLEYPDLYREHQLIARKTPTQHTDRLGHFKAQTWDCVIYGPQMDGAVVAAEAQLPEEAIAAAMQFLDIHVGKVKSKRRFAEYYDAALERVTQRLQIG